MCAFCPCRQLLLVTYWDQMEVVWWGPSPRFPAYLDDAAQPEPEELVQSTGEMHPRRSRRDVLAPGACAPLVPLRRVRKRGHFCRRNRDGQTGAAAAMPLAAWLNSSRHWATAATGLNRATRASCGRVCLPLTVQGSGTEGHPVTFYFEREPVSRRSAGPSPGH